MTYDNPNIRQKETTLKVAYMTFGVFFDGTLNNRTNVAAREQYEKELADTKKRRFSYAPSQYAKNGKKDEESSYHGDYSNVALLNKAYRKSEDVINLYIEGIATEDLEADDSEGAGFGMGASGIRAKVKKACLQLTDKFDGDKFGGLNIDIFGFSRGAAAARNFAYEITRSDGITKEGEVDKQEYVTKGVKAGGFLGYFLEKKGLDIANITINIRFVGLFDTVASYDPEGLIGGPKVISYAPLLITPISFNVDPKFKEGAKLLHMNAGVAKAKKAVHLVSDDEHRQNFAITPIQKSTKATEKKLPGVHSDIGGGYRNKAHEEVEIKLQRRGTDDLLKRAQALRAQGWYTDKKDELSVKEETSNYFDRVVRWNKLVGKRQLSNEYAYIVLNIMAKYGFEVDDKMFDVKKLQKIPSLPSNQGVIAESAWYTYMNSSLAELFFKWKEDVNTFRKDNIRGYTGTVPDENIIATLKPQREQDWKKFIESWLDCSTKDGKLAELCMPVDSDEGLLIYAQKRIQKIILGESNGWNYIPSSTIFNTYKLNHYNEDSVNKVKNALFKRIIDQIYLKGLRNRYLHWSAHYKGLFFKENMVIPPPHKPTENNSPTESGIRETYYA